MTGEITGVRKRAPTDEKCPSCKLHDRTAWLNVETTLIGGSIEVQLCCSVPTCGIVVRRPAHVPAETGKKRSRVRSSFRSLRDRVFTPGILATAVSIALLFGYVLLR